MMGIYGTTAGSHRLFCHRTYTANSFLRFLLMICQTMAGQVSETRRIWHFDTLFHCVNNFLLLSTLSFPPIDFQSTFRVQSTTGWSSTVCIIRHSRQLTIRSIAIRTLCMHNFSHTCASWAQDRKNCSQRSTWRISSRTRLWCSRSDSIGFYTLCCSHFCQSMHHSSTGMTPCQRQSLSCSQCDISSWSTSHGWWTRHTLFGDWIRTRSNRTRIWCSLWRRGE